MLPELDENVHHLAAAARAWPGPGDHVAERPLGRRLHPAARALGSPARELEDGVRLLRVARRDLGHHFLPLGQKKQSSRPYADRKKAGAQSVACI